MSALSRRRFLGAALGAGGLALSGACGGRGGDDDLDLDFAHDAAAMEAVIVEHYRGTATLAIQGRLGAAVPPVVMELVTRAAGQHQEQLDAWGAILAGAGRSADAGHDPAIRAALATAAPRVTDVPAAATLALRLEDFASQTYLAAVPTLRRPEVVGLAAQILVVDQQRQAVLRYLLGLGPVGSGVAREAGGVAPSDPRPALITG